MLDSYTWNHLTVCKQLLYLKLSVFTISSRTWNVLTECSGSFKKYYLRAILRKTIYNICINRIWHWISIKGWYAIKPKNPTFNSLSTCLRLFYALTLRIDLVLWHINHCSLLIPNSFLYIKTVLFQTIQFSTSIQFSSIWPIDRTLSGATTPG